MIKKLVVLLCLCHVMASAQSAPDGYDMSSLSRQGHPRLLMDMSDFGMLREKIAKPDNDVLKQLHDVILTTAEGFLKNQSSLNYELDIAGKRLLAVSRLALSRISACAYAYRMTGEKRFLESVRRDMESVCSFPDWNPDHYLDVGEMALAVSVGYDWLYDELSPEIRALAEKALNEYAFGTALAEKSPWFYRRANNWNQVCNGGLVAAAVALYEKYPESARMIIEKAVVSNRAAMEEMYPPDGNYAEGYGYWRYGTTYETLMLKILEKSLGTDFGLSQVPGFFKTADYMLFMEGIKGSFNYSDSGSMCNPALGMWYFADKLGRPELLYHEIKALKAGKYYNFDDWRFVPLIMCFAANVEPDSVGHPKENYWNGSGDNPVVMVRKDWTCSSSDAYLAVKAGKASCSHGHMDVGSFVYDAYGVRWSMDLGMQTYADLENAAASIGRNLWSMKQDSWRWEILRYNNLYHSTVTVDDALHKVDGEGRVIDFVNNVYEKGMVMDMSEVLDGRVEEAVRKVVMLDDGGLRVTDRIVAPADKDVKYSWRMVTGAVTEIGKQGIVLKSGGVEMALKAASNVKFKYCQWSAEPQNSWDEPNDGVSVVGIEAVVEKGMSSEFVVTLYRQEAPNYDENKIAPYNLPDPLVTSKGKAVKNVRQWEKVRRPELLSLFETEMFGRMPGKPSGMHYELLSEKKDALGGAATRKEVMVWFDEAESVGMTLLIHIPNGADGPVPAFVGANFKGNYGTTSDPTVSLPSEAQIKGYGPMYSLYERGENARRWPYEYIISQGYAVVTFCREDVDPDWDDSFMNGVHGLMDAGKEREADSWGTIAAWAWGLSRAMDYIETAEKSIDSGRVAVMGHSRLGKTALWAGATDERFAIVISNDSGCSGAALSRRVFGEHLLKINTVRPQWFCINYHKYNSNEADLPFDQHELIALIAPRPVYVASASEDRNADPKGEMLSLVHASPVYELYGYAPLVMSDLPPVNTQVSTDRMGYHLREGVHDIVLFDWQQYISFADRFFK